MIKCILVVLLKLIYYIKKRIYDELKKAQKHCRLNDRFLDDVEFELAILNKIMDI